MYEDTSNPPPAGDGENAAGDGAVQPQPGAAGAAPPPPAAYPPVSQPPPAEEPPAPSVGISETMEFLGLIFSICAAIAKSKKNDGKIGLSDLPNLIGVIPHIAPAIGNIGGIAAELADIDNKELAIIQDEVGRALGISGADEKVAIAVSNALKAAHSLGEVVKAFLPNNGED